MNSPVQNADILILGAGVAGLSAALQAFDEAKARGLPAPRITLLEAGSAPGGRIRTVADPGGVPINLGAHWFHGGNANPFYHWVKNRYPDLAFAAEDALDNLRTIFNGASYGEDLCRRFDEDMRAAYQAFKAAHPDEDIAFGEIARQLGPGAQAYARYMTQLWASADDPMEISSDDLLAEGFGPGGMQLAGGNGKLIERMVAELQAQGAQIITSCAVSEIAQDAHGVTMTTQDGRVFTAQQAISTASVGVLKSGALRFTPEFPALAAALEDLTMGHMAKICLTLREEFFTKHNIDADTHIDIMGDDPLAFCHARTGGKPTITVFAGGSIMSRKVEAMSPQEALAHVDATLGKVAGFEDYRQYLEGAPLVTDWSGNPYVRGAYSSVFTGGTRSAPLRLGRVTVAGEAFVTQQEDGASCMSGAWASGRDAGTIAVGALVFAAGTGIKLQPKGP